jgi:DNA-binding transcriptional LysR family regulator
VAVHEGFTRAAEHFPYSITEPALHQQVRKLERSLGVTLLIKGAKRRMVLTPAGRALFQFCQPFYEQLPGVLQGLSQETRGELRIGSEPLYVDDLVAPLMGRLRAALPECVWHLTELDLEPLAEALRHGRLDLGIAQLGEVPLAGLASVPLGRLGLELRVPREHPLARKRPPLRPSHLAGLECLVYSRETQARAWADAAFAEAGLCPRPVAEASSAAAMRALVAAGVAPAFLPALVGKKRPRRRVNTDGTVSFDLTAALEKMAGLPRYGLLHRAGEPSGILARAIELAQA